MTGEAEMIGQLLMAVESLQKKQGELEAQLREITKAQAIDARRDSLDIQTAAKGGNFKHYLDPGATAHENDLLLAEEARNFVNSGGVLPENFSPRIKALIAEIERSAAAWKPPAPQGAVQ